MANNLTPTGRVSKAKGRGELLMGSGGELPAAFRGRKVNMTMDEFVNHIRLLPGMADKAFVKYVVALSKRALVIFDHSFKEHRFYSANGKPWKPITDTTWKLRQYHAKKYGKKLSPREHKLEEFGYLRGSIEIDKSTLSSGGGLYRRKVWTNPEKFRSPVHNGFVYAGVHNDPNRSDTYGTRFGRKRAIKRQFMGHSTYMDDFMTRYASRYLFDEIFNRASEI